MFLKTFIALLCLIRIRKVPANLPDNEYESDEYVSDEYESDEYVSDEYESDEY